MAAYLAGRGLRPDLVVVSPSRRTRQTWKRTAAAFEPLPQVNYDERLYGETSDPVLDVLKETPPDVRTLLVIGHNPSLQELAVRLVGSEQNDARKRLKVKFPKACARSSTFQLRIGAECSTAAVSNGS